MVPTLAVRALTDAVAWKIGLLRVQFMAPLVGFYLLICLSSNSKLIIQGPQITKKKRYDPSITVHYFAEKQFRQNSDVTKYRIERNSVT